ncbi:MAG: PP2C family protein-serine/threonine phosphatase [Leptospira sp.]|nr:PP2C family protein-serine/threonine phosphatase [Leptospira sp.]
MNRDITILVSTFFLISCNFQFPSTEAGNTKRHSIYNEKREYLWVESKLDVSTPENLIPSSWSEFNSNQLGLNPIANHDLWIRFPDSNVSRFKNPTLYIEIAIEKIQVFHGSEQVYLFENTDYVFPHIIPLKNESKGYIYIKCESKYHSFIGLDHSVEILEHSDAIIDLFTKNFLRSSLTPVLLFLSVLFFGIYVLKTKAIFNLYFSLLLLSSSIIEGLNGFTGFSMQGYDKILSSVQYLNYMICPILLMLFLGEIFPRFFKNVFRLFILLHLCLYFTYLFRFRDNGHFSYLNTEWAFSWWMVLEAIFVIFSAVYILIRGEVKLTLITFGILSVVFAGAHDTLVDLEFLPYKFQIIHFGFWMGILSFSYFVFRYYLMMVRSLDEYNLVLVNKNKELERLVAIDKDLELAKELQKSLLSSLQKGDENIDIISFNHSLHSVGGDYFDYIKDSMGNWGILICDVAGHGISSAVVAAMAKMAFTATSPYIQYPAKVFNSMNRNLHGKNRGMFITASYLYIDMESRVLSFVNAGHPIFFLIRNGSPRLLDFKSKGRPLGIFPDSEYTVGKVSLEYGDRIFLYTDGIPDLSSPSLGAFGEDRLRQLLWDLRNEPFLKFHESIQKELSIFSKSWAHQDDDVSYILIELKEPNLVQDSK